MTPSVTSTDNTQLVQASFNADGTVKQLTAAGVPIQTGGASNFSQLTGAPTDNAALASALAGKLATTSVVNDLSTGGTAAPLSAAQGVVLGANKLWIFNGTPDNAIGQNGDHGLRIDKPFGGIPYTKSAGAWVADDNTYTLATLPIASATYFGIVARVNDATPAGLDFECVTYDGGTSYYWVPSRGHWLILNDTTAKTAFTGSASGTISGTAYTFPNRPDMFPPGIMVEFETLSSVTNSTNAKTVSITNSPATVTLHQTSTSTTGIIALSQRSRLQYTGASSTVEFSYSGSGAGFGSASVAPQNINIALANMPIVYTAALGLTSESITLLTRRIRIEYQ